MPKDHFVPQHYLKKFSKDEKHVVAATVAPYSHLGELKIGDECQEVEFYENHEGLNKLLWTSENDLAPALRQVIQKRDFDERELNGLKLLAVVLYLRTRKAREAAKVFPKSMAKEVISNAVARGELPRPSGDAISEDMFDFSGVSASLLHNSITCWMETQTLSGKLLAAKGPMSFITSDNPVAVLNQFCTSADPHRGYAGFSRSGFQLVLPLSPSLCLFLYDAKVYKVGDRRQRVVAISSDDVAIVNSLQIQSAEERVYWQDQALESEVRKQVSKYSTLRVSDHDLMRRIPTSNPKQELIHIRNHSVTIPAQWTFCRYRRHVNCSIGDRRNPAWTELASRLEEDIASNPAGGNIFKRIETLLSGGPSKE